VSSVVTFFSSQNIKNLFPSEADATSFIPDKNDIGIEVKKPTTEKVNSSPFQLPPTLFPQQCHQSNLLSTLSLLQ
jgi:hypothetical protein